MSYRLTDADKVNYIMQICDDDTLIDRTEFETIEKAIACLGGWISDRANEFEDEHEKGCEIADIEPTLPRSYFLEKAKLELEGQLVELYPTDVLRAAEDGYPYPLDFGWVTDVREEAYENHDFFERL